MGVTVHILYIHIYVFYISKILICKLILFLIQLIMFFLVKIIMKSFCVHNIPKYILQTPDTYYSIFNKFILSTKLLLFLQNILILLKNKNLASTLHKQRLLSISRFTQQFWR